MGNWRTLLKISKEIEEYKNINGVSSVKNHCLLCSIINLLFTILIIPFICLLVYFVLGLIKSEFSNLVLLSYVLLIIGIYIICFSIVYSKTFGLGKLYKLFEKNRAFCFICSNKIDTALNDAFSTWVHIRGYEEEFGYVADVVRHSNNPIQSVEIKDGDNEGIDDLFSNTTPKKTVSEDLSNMVEEIPNRVMNTEERPTRPSRPSRASKQSLENKNNSSDIDDLFK